MPAHAGEHDRADCLAVGMDDFLAKPVCREELRRMLARHLPPVARAPESGQPGPAETLPVQAEAGYRAAGEALTDSRARQTGDRMVGAR